ncbi:LON peptidase substrate-binding domain-containing protein [Cocleimonas sp. KMM 6892]|uniref:LON peptidase substrate-binding domain-containing protein n=1 Tax=unclassified Cocleimonas TaxID=2639732 RepID=UPI002DBDBC4F|nr:MULTISPECIES: LON peptidase substrate-binding domain-containing protein [unclassified Cocleimonas]MEB8431578.1 LON peptidase substrate-binding domain-containing protein [Cocleimonas sp. KMM 6892]MEC4713650.1 LON peptidase substrate-binding domain-containing protein [Cocleimonas sp. KMM 6895]MEC4742981.1 LON peptidase substrate-binding domain-containing protein [Cocleimonas sp. KMM 6896]
MFPLANAVVMPGGHLPLNIFEPRYINMLQDAMENHRLIGMIQPRDESAKPELYNIGCAARIARYEETNDGRLEISLTGLCRFEIKDEIVTTRGYRLIVPDWSKFAMDYDDQSEPDATTQKSFISALKSYFNQTDMKLDWEVMEKLDSENLLNALFYFLNLSDEDKQMLIEIDTIEQRIKALTAILESTSKISEVRH